MKMEVVLDANVLFRILISHGAIVTIIFNDNLNLFAPEQLREEFLRHKDELLQKSSLDEREFEEMILLIFDEITFVPRSDYLDHIPDAKKLLREHIKDTDFVALALHKKCRIWTYENRIFNIGVGVSTKEIAETIF